MTYILDDQQFKAAIDSLVPPLMRTIAFEELKAGRNFPVQAGGLQRLLTPEGALVAPPTNENAARVPKLRAAG